MAEVFLEARGYTRGRCISFNIWYGLVHIGTCDIERNDFTNRACGHYQIKELFWGKGFGTLMQDAIEKMIEQLGYEVTIAPYLSVRAYRFWMKRDPSRVTHPAPPEDRGFTYSEEAARLLNG